MSKQATNLIILLIFCFSISKAQQQPNRQQNYYSNKQARTCMQNKGLSVCQQFIQKCSQSQQCIEQLGKYQSCSFSQVQNIIFNGYCFRKWHQTAILTKDLIGCLVKQCDLQYNSLIGLQELYQCAQQTVINNYVECDEECLKQLNKIKDNLLQRKVQQLFNIQLQNQIANDFVKKIKKNCLQAVYQDKKQKVIQKQVKQPNQQMSKENNKQNQKIIEAQGKIAQQNGEL